jgi:hypothetical protein
MNAVVTIATTPPTTYAHLNTPWTAQRRKMSSKSLPSLSLGKGTSFCTRTSKCLAQRLPALLHIEVEELLLWDNLLQPGKS